MNRLFKCDNLLSLPIEQIAFVFTANQLHNPHSAQMLRIFNCDLYLLFVRIGSLLWNALTVFNSEMACLSLLRAVVLMNKRSVSNKAV